MTFENQRPVVCDRSSVGRAWLIVPILLATLLFSLGCDIQSAEQPPYTEQIVLRGTPYERGFQHGERFSSKIKSLYTMMLTNSIYPYLNRERKDVASVMLRYQEEEYLDGSFSYKMMLRSGEELAKTMPQQYVEEMHGIADGAGVPYEQVLILNTFFDTLMGFRGITFYIKLIQAPSIQLIEFIADIDDDGIDNDGDGEVDEQNEGLYPEYEVRPYAHAVELPTNAKIRLIMDDKLEGVRPSLVRFQLGEQVFQYPDPAIEINEYDRDGKTIEVILTPPGGLKEATAYPLKIMAGDWNEIVDPPPLHARFMRDERVTFTTKGYGKTCPEVPNQGVEDGQTQPPSYAFAVKDSATTDGSMYVATHFAMLDNNTAHKHNIHFIHIPDDGPAFTYIGYPGVVWGFSGINEEGLVFAYNTADTLNNQFTGGFNEGLVFGELYATGVPMGVMGRELLATCSTVDQGLDYIHSAEATFGWVILLTDNLGNMAVAEVDSNIQNFEGHGFFYYSNDPSDPNNLDEFGQPYASVGPDDLLAASHYQKNLDEINYTILTFDLKPQRNWSSFYFRSLRTFFTLGDEIKKKYGELDLKSVLKIMRIPVLVDSRDSMAAVIYEPEKLRFHYGAGEVPATDAPFRMFDFKAFLEKEREDEVPSVGGLK